MTRKRQMTRRYSRRSIETSFSSWRWLVEAPSLPRAYGGVPASGRIVRAPGAASNGPSGESPPHDLADRTGGRGRSPGSSNGPVGALRLTSRRVARTGPGRSGAAGAGRPPSRLLRGRPSPPAPPARAGVDRPEPRVGDPPARGRALASLGGGGRVRLRPDDAERPQPRTQPSRSPGAPSAASVPAFC